MPVLQAKERGRLRKAALFLLTILLLLPPVVPVRAEVPAETEAQAAEPTEAAPKNPLALDVVPTVPPLPEAPEAIPLRSARIRAVGDLMMHDKQLKIARQSDGSYDFHPQYELIAPSLADADYTIANLEMTVGKYKDTEYSGYPLFNAPESMLDAIRDAGIDFLTLANNHILDRYFTGMQRTVELVDEYGFAHGGANRTPEEHDTPVIVEVNGIKLGMICTTQMTNGMETYCNDAVKVYGVNYLDKTNFTAEVARLRELGADIVISLPHWGDEYLRQPGPYQVEKAKQMIAAGVDVILASHPHMIQPVKWVTVDTEDGGQRTGLVAYCLGDFISNMTKRYTDAGIILEFTIQEQQDGSLAIENVGYVPVFTWREENMIRTVSSAKYRSERPTGMTDDMYDRLKTSYRDTTDLLGDWLIVLTE